jgi:preprotein translocase subunit YajC
MTELLTIILQKGLDPGVMNMIFIVLLIAIFYLFMIRPQMRKAKLEQQFKNSVQKGDRIVTIGGIHGKIVDVQEKTFLIEVDTNSRMKIEKTAVSAEASKQYAEKKNEGK